MQRLRTPVPRHLSSHSALSSYGLFAPHALWRLCLYTTSGSGCVEFPGFWGPWSSAMPLSLRKQQQKQCPQVCYLYRHSRT